jgi:hypothetical protein
MAEVFAPFRIERTICNLTFYMMDGRNFVREKSSLTKRKVLYSPQFKNTRHFAGLMGIASKIGSHVYSALPAYWRQGWMFRSFTGEAYSMLKKGNREEEILQVLYQRYVEEVVSRQPKEEIKVPSLEPPKRAYRKLNSQYWRNKTIKSNRRKARKAQTMQYAGLMAQASKIGSKLYARLPREYVGRSHYQYLTGLALKLLKLEICDEDILAGLLPTLPGANRHGKASTFKKAENVVRHQKGQYFFMPTLHKRFSIPATIALPRVCHCSRKTNTINGT